MKNLWISGNGLFFFSFRKEMKDMPLVYREITLPPIEEINGRRIGISEAKELGLEERHTTFGGFTREELEFIRDEIDTFLNL